MTMVPYGRGHMPPPPQPNALGTVLTIDSTGLATFLRSIVIGAPTGGDKGAGTLNATGLFINGTAVTGATITVTQSGSAVGDVDSAIPTGANSVNEGDYPAVDRRSVSCEYPSSE